MGDFRPCSVHIILVYFLLFFCFSVVAEVTTAYRMCSKRITPSLFTRWVPDAVMNDQHGLSTSSYLTASTSQNWEPSNPWSPASSCKLNMTCSDGVCPRSGDPTESDPSTRVPRTHQKLVPPILRKDTPAKCQPNTLNFSTHSYNTPKKHK